jgi:RNA polymerase sigma-70 factor (ECF subfamily)
MARREEFERKVLPLLPAAYNLARWITRHPQDAEDAVQDALLRAFRAFDGFHGDDPKAWLLTIVRNSCRTAFRRGERWRNVIPLDLAFRGPSAANEADGAPPPDSRLDAAHIHAAIEQLPDGLRETLVLRELEELSYAEIATVTEVPIGTVMSRLSRARARLREALDETAPAPSRGVER